jgi:hypothetical protein
VLVFVIADGRLHHAHNSGHMSQRGGSAGPQRRTVRWPLFKLLLRLALTLLVLAAAGMRSCHLQLSLGFHG